MLRIATAVFALLAAACGHDRLSLLEREALVFRTENEKIRAEDLRRAYERAKAESDRLAERLLELARERDRLYAEYDARREEISLLRRALEEARAETAALRANLDETEK